MMTRKYGEYVCLLTVMAALSAIPVAAQHAWTLPLIPAGKAPGPQPTPSPISTVTASVGGVEATVVSARLVPDRSGVYAVSVLVPNSLSPGLVPVKIASAAAASQDGAYIRIR